MEMKKATCVVLFAVACISTAMAHSHDMAEAPASLATPAAPRGSAAALDPFFAVSLLSFVAYYYLQF
ncbi:hypothetical protein PHAVU_005G036200 [Phaseolus vulgaris]|uniref:Uncharacterized protein n=1 Tax=Phaseolus vulgaris TaxID=3885 RepID=V7BVG4_PHAVU|nr:hypothetical protein PHAVU_005G036200g [Phaseolus vulgaris]ESW21040.1 hypothetical protein PHAVU_005G036200g [Phaseolus vulgaris]